MLIAAGADVSIKDSRGDNAETRALRKTKGKSESTPTSTAIVEAIQGKATPDTGGGGASSSV